MKAKSPISQWQFEILRLDHLSFFTDSDRLHLGCTTARNGKQVSMLLKMDFEVLSNLIQRIPDAQGKLKLFAIIGKCLSQKIAGWEYIQFREILGQQLILTNLSLIPKLNKNPNSQKTEILGFINLS
jgi:hypothetical protein